MIFEGEGGAGGGEGRWKKSKINKPGERLFGTQECALYLLSYCSYILVEWIFLPTTNFKHFSLWWLFKILLPLSQQN